MKLCSVCKTAERMSYGSRCRDCYNSYMADYMLKRYHERRPVYVAEWGGVCVDCGTSDELEFDHADASSKSIDVGKMFTSYSDVKIRAELEKCVLRCQECHLVKTQEYDMGAVEHGGGVSGKRNCSCSLCKLKKREYNKLYKFMGA
jgi:hypothetical protein